MKPTPVFAKRLTQFFVIALFAIGSLIRIIPALIQPVALDEAFAVFEAKTATLRTFTASSPPLFPIFFKPWTAISVRLLWIRLPSLVFGILTIYMFRKLFRNGYSGRVAPFIAGCFAATSALLVHYSWFARIYGTEILIISISLLLLFSITQSIRQNKFPKLSALAALSIINAIGSLLSYGYIPYLAACAVSLVVWLCITKRWRVVAAHWKLSAGVTTVHLMFIGSLWWWAAQKVTEIHEENAWLPTLHIPTFIQLLGTLTNTTNTYFHPVTSAPALMLWSVMGIGFLVLTVLAVPKRMELFKILLPISLLVTFLTSYVSPVLFQTSTVLPRFFIFVHVLFLASMAAIGISLTTPASPIRRSTVLTTAALMYLLLYVFCDIVSFFAINIVPAYTDPKILPELSAIQKRSEMTYVAPAGFLPLVWYVWGAPDTHALRAVTADEANGKIPSRFALIDFFTDRPGQLEQIFLKKARQCEPQRLTLGVVYYCH